MEKKCLSLFIILIFFISFSSPVEIKLSKTDYSPFETIIGSIENTSAKIGIDNLKIFEGRREVSFEKGLISVDNSYYFYIIPPKEGYFEIELVSIKANDLGNTGKSGLKKNITVSKNESEVKFSVSPGVYSGKSPSTTVRNLGQEGVSITYGNSSIYLEPEEYKKIFLDVPSGFSIYSIGDYKIPILNLVEKIENQTVDEKNTTIEEELDLSEGSLHCLIINYSTFYSVVKESVSNFTIYLYNNCSRELQNLSFSSEEGRIDFYNDNIILLEEQQKPVMIRIREKEIGNYSEKIFIKMDNVTLANLSTRLYIFSDNTDKESFEEEASKQTHTSCTVAGGTFCDQDTQYCDSDNRFLDQGENKICCLGKCKNLKGKETNWGNILIAILGIGIIGFVGYYLYNRYKKMKSPQAEDRFREAEKLTKKNSVKK